MRVIALGFFDGVHIGHRLLLDTCKSIAAEKGLTSAVLTFSSPPVSKTTQRVLSTQEEKTAILREIGIEELLLLPFDDRLRQMHWTEFAELLGTGYMAKHLVIGKDFRFGFRAEGDALKLSEYCKKADIGITVLSKVQTEGVAVSSSRIKALLLAGKVAEARDLLLEPYSLCGVVQKGKQLGRTLGYPTMNVRPAEEKILPLAGVYKTTAKIEGICYPAITNIGKAPTFTEGDVLMETHLLGNVNGDFYGKTVRISFLRFIREERGFPSKDALAAQIAQDILAAKETSI